MAEITPCRACVEHGPANIDFTDERFIDPEYLDAYRSGTLHAHFPTHGEHDMVVVATGGQVAAIDKDIAYLLHAMWKAGVRTTESCQGDGGLAGVWFADMRDAELFASLVLQEDGEAFSLWDRATGGHLHFLESMEDEPDADPFDMWRCVDKVTWTWDIAPRVHGRRVSWNISVGILKLDIPDVAARLINAMGMGEDAALASKLYQENR